jgi:PAS domain S-box-containing protein
MTAPIQFTLWSLPSLIACLLAGALLLWMTTVPKSRELDLLRALVAIVALWAAAHFIRTLATTLPIKIAAQALVLPATIGLAALYAVFALDFSGRWRGSIARVVAVVLLVELMLAFVILLPSTRAWIYSSLTLTSSSDGFIGLAVEFTRTGRALIAIPSALAIFGLLALTAEALRDATRRTTAVLYLLLGLVVLPTLILLRNLWLEGQTPVNLAPVVLSGSMLMLAGMAIHSRDRLRDLSMELILEHLPYAMILADGDGRVVTANAAAASEFGIAAKGLEGIRIRDVVGFDPETEEESISDRVIWHGKHKHRYDVTQTTIERPDSTVVARALLLEDRTSFRETRDGLHALTDELLLQAAELEAVNSAKRSFISNCSDSLGEPLQSILLESERLLERLAQRSGMNDAESFVREIAQGARQLHALVEDIRVFEATGREAALEIGEVDAFELVEAITTQLAPLAAAKSVDLCNRAPPAFGTLQADRQKLRQVLVNLASNAIKFTPDGGTVNVAVERTAEGTMFSITDSGIGISEEDLGRIFAPFEQVDSSLSRRHGGTGLGLALVRRLTELHGGRVEVESEERSGSTFRAVFPAALAKSGKRSP